MPLREEIFDVEDLKDQIRQIRAKKNSYLREKDELEAENAKLEMLINGLRREINILGSIEQTRYVNANRNMDGENIEEFDCKCEIQQATGKRADEVQQRERFFLQNNQKLEIGILCADIRRALPKLEAEVNRSERKVKDASMVLKKESTIILSKPGMYTKSSEEVKTLSRSIPPPCGLLTINSTLCS